MVEGIITGPSRRVAGPAEAKQTPTKAWIPVTTSDHQPAMRALESQPGWRQTLMGTTARVESRVAAEQRTRLLGDWGQVLSLGVGGIRVWVVTRVLAKESDHWVLMWRTKVREPAARPSRYKYEPSDERYTVEIAGLFVIKCALCRFVGV